MPIYDYRCTCGHAFELLVLGSTSGSSSATCSACSGPARKVPSAVGLHGKARAGAGKEGFPQTWVGTSEGDPGRLVELQRRWYRRQELEDRHPELRGDARRVLAHEGQFSDAPLLASPAASGSNASLEQPFSSGGKRDGATLRKPT